MSKELFLWGFHSTHEYFKTPRGITDWATPPFFRRLFWGVPGVSPGVSPGVPGGVPGCPRGCPRVSPEQRRGKGGGGTTVTWQIGYVGIVGSSVPDMEVLWGPPSPEQENAEDRH